MRNSLILLSFLCCLKLHAQDLKTHQWENRILIVKTNDASSTKFQTQLKEFRQAAKEMIERKFVMYAIMEDEYTYINYKSLTLNNVGKTSGKLAKTLNKKEEFEVILIGLDGGIKLRETEVMIRTVLFNKVDSMPMRRSELRKKQKKN